MVSFRHTFRPSCWAVFLKICLAVPLRQCCKNPHTWWESTVVVEVVRHQDVGHLGVDDLLGRDLYRPMAFRPGEPRPGDGALRHEVVEGVAAPGWTLLLGVPVVLVGFLAGCLLLKDL